jgi:hypothetical protein
MGKKKRLKEIERLISNIEKLRQEKIEKIEKDFDFELGNIYRKLEEYGSVSLENTIEKDFFNNQKQTYTFTLERYV